MTDDRADDLRDQFNEARQQSHDYYMDLRTEQERWSRSGDRSSRSFRDREDERDE